MRAVGFAGVALVSSLAVASFARGDDAAPGSSRIVIRGTGRDVVVERVPIPSPRLEGERGVLAQAARLAAAGADDREVLGYLRAHREEIPAILNASDVGRLRKAGTGDSVVAYLASVSAFDVGVTGEGRAAAAQGEVAPPESEGYAGDHYGGYYGGGYYGGGYGGNAWRGIIRSGHFPKHSFGLRFGFHPMHPIARPGFPKGPRSGAPMGHGGAPHRGRM